MFLKKPSDLVIIGKIISEVKPLQMDEPDDIITSVVSSYFGLKKCSFRMYVSSITHLRKEDNVIKDLPLENKTVEVHTSVPTSMELFNGNCVMVRGTWQVVPDEKEKYKVLVDSSMVEKVERNLIVKDDYVKPESMDSTRFLLLDNRF